MKRHISILLTITFLITAITSSWSIAFAAPASAGAATQSVASLPPQPTVSAGSAILMNAKTGDVLWRRNSSIRRPMASTTKIMTALVAIEHGNLDDVVTVNADALGPGSLGGVGLAKNEHITLRDLLYALLLPSANDAAVAIADHVGGSVGGFADMMNKKAVEIGANRTHFDNPHGLDSPTHYTTAYDLALITRYAMKNPTFSQIVSTKSWRLHGTKVVTTHNNLLAMYSPATGVKTGFTNRAGSCLVSSATKGDVSLIAVVLGEKRRPNMFTQSAGLLSYGFSLYQEKQLTSAGVVYKTITSPYGQKLDLVAKEASSATVRHTLPIYTETHYAEDTPLPVKKGAILGRVVSYQAGRPVAAADLQVKNDPLQPTLMQMAGHYLSPLFGSSLLDV
ncbi:MAG: D-alanyl-D-alanine carboxypeptidase family protein [Candidatus Aquicultor sp.]